MPSNYSHCRGLPQFVYVMGSWSSGIVKIGFTADLQGRRGALQAGYPGRLEILWFTSGGRGLELELHGRLADHRTLREWFEFSDARSALTSVVGAALEILSDNPSLALPPAPPDKPRDAPVEPTFPGPPDLPKRARYVLKALLSRPGAWRSGNLIGATGLSAPDVSKGLRVLVERGLARRFPDARGVYEASAIAIEDEGVSA